MSIGLGVGTFVGMLPGLGSTVGAFLSYGIAKQASPEKKIGTGKIEGVAAAEAGNNATVGPTLVPLLAFGIPGSAVAALIGAALMLQGATPGPRMFELYPTSHLLAVPDPDPRQLLQSWHRAHLRVRLRQAWRTAAASARANRHGHGSYRRIFLRE